MDFALNHSIPAPKLRLRLSFKSIKAKLLTIVGLGIAVSYTAMIVTSHIGQQQRFRTMAFEVNRTLTDLMSDQAAEGVMERDEEKIERIYFDIVFGAHKGEDHSDLSALGVYTADGERVKSYLSLDHLDFPEAELMRLATTALQTGRRQEQMISGAHVVASPISRSKYDEVRVGAFVVAWNTKRIETLLWQDAKIQIGIALASGVLIFACLGMMLHKYVVAPIRQLTEESVKIGQTGSLNKRSWPSLTRRSDELGILSRQFDRMVDQLADAQRKLLDQSYYGGMAEMAAGVLHNVRNALSPISIGLWKVAATIEAPVAANLERAIDELASGETLPERRTKLAMFAKQSFALQQEQRQATLADLKSVAEQTRHIEAILQDHSLFAKERRRLEPVSLADILVEAMQIVAKGPTAPGVVILPAVADAPAIYGHRIILTQVFGNLFVNAANSIEQAGDPDGRIEVDVEVEEQSGKRSLHVVVRDNGMGIDEATRERLFERGFSTKTGKSGGLGLHWSANCLSSIGGRMFATSDGPGQGASFHLILPAWEPGGERS